MNPILEILPQVSAVSSSVLACINSSPSSQMVKDIIKRKNILVAISLGFLYKTKKPMTADITTPINGGTEKRPSSYAISNVS
jgi:hypothetical protein